MQNKVFDRFRSSLLRCLSNLKFLDKFYHEFFSSSHEVEEAFSTTDMERQKAMLSASLYQLMNFYESQDQDTREHIEDLGAIHGNHALRISPHLYDMWLESLLVAVSATDPEYDEELEKIWREVMMYGINLMKEAADKEPVAMTYSRLEPEAEKNVDIDSSDVKNVIRILNKLGKEAAHRSNMEKDLEITAYQFGQYRAYVHASELIFELLRINKKTF